MGLEKAGAKKNEANNRKRKMEESGKHITKHLKRSEKNEKKYGKHVVVKHAEKAFPMLKTECPLFLLVGPQSFDENRP